jgi:DNA-binding protein YbaB
MLRWCGRRTYSSAAEDALYAALGRMHQAFQKQQSPPPTSDALAGTSKDGGVRVTLDASHRMSALHISPQLARGPTHELEDSLREAVGDVVRRAPFRVDPSLIYQKSASTLSTFLSAAMGSRPKE